MPRRRTTTTVEEIPPTEETVEVINTPTISDDTPADIALSDFLSGIRATGDEATVAVYEDSGKGMPQQFIFSFPVEEMTDDELLARLANECGPGKYRIHVKQHGRWLANRVLAVSDKAKAGTAPEIAPKSNEFGPAEFIALMQQQSNQMQAMVTQMMTAFATAFGSAQSNTPSVNPVEMQNSVIQGIATMKEIANSGEKKEPGAVEMLIKGLTLANELAPKTGDTNTNDLLLKAMEMFPMLKEAGNLVPRGTPHGIPMQPHNLPRQPIQHHVNPPIEMDGKRIEALAGEQTSTGLPGPALQKEEEFKQTVDQDQEKQMFMMQARASLQWLCNLAKQNRDPELYAQVVLDQMGSEKTQEFLASGDESAVLKQLTAIEPTVEYYAGWFGELRAVILDILEEQAETKSQGPINAVDEDEIGVPDRLGPLREADPLADPTVPQGNERGPINVRFGEGPPTDDPNVVLARINAAKVREHPDATVTRHEDSDGSTRVVTPVAERPSGDTPDASDNGRDIPPGSEKFTG